MPSSLIFAALAGAWLVVLVPMIAKRRQEVRRIADSALASRVLPRRKPSRHVLSRRRISRRAVSRWDLYRDAPEHDQEVPVRGERIGERELASEERQYRPGRGGYDPEAAALAARARYVFRQRVVLGLLAAAVLTLVLGFANSLFWFVHAVVDTTLIGYLAYLRRQVRIEEELRERRAARMAGSRSRVPLGGSHSAEGWSSETPDADGWNSDSRDSGKRDPDGWDSDGWDSDGWVEGLELDGERSPPEQPQHQKPPDAEPPAARRAAPAPPAHPTAVALDLDDDDPMFDELDPAFEPPYRRAAGE